MRIGFYMLGKRKVDITYRYRRDIDTGVHVLGKPQDFYRCNVFIAKCRLEHGGGHFYNSDMQGRCTWNPHDVFTDDLWSLRGFHVRVR